MRWCSDGFAEQAMREFGVAWKEVEVALGDIDMKGSQENRARLVDPLDSELVQEYALAMERGDVFPMIVVLKRKGKKLLILGGNHRAAAVELYDARQPIKCYLIDSDDEKVVDVLPRILNRGHGKRQDRAEAVQHAIFVAEKYGYNAVQVEKMFGLRTKVVQDELRLRKVRERLHAMNVSKADSLSKSALDNLSVMKNDNVLASVARMLIQHQMTAAAARQFITAVKDQRTEAQQMAVVADYEDKLGGPTEEKPQKFRTPLRTKFLQTITHLERQLDGKRSLAQLQIAKREEVGLVRERLQALIAGFGRLCNGLPAGQKTPTKRAG